MHEPPVLAVMTKAPVCGTVNTRLAREIGPVAATALARTLTAALLRELAHDPRFRTVLAIAPDVAIFAPFAAWTMRHPGTARRLTGRHPDQAKREPGAQNGLPFISLRLRISAKALSGVTVAAKKCGRIPQGPGGLGQRMQRIFDRCGRGPLIIVGADIPFITREIVAKAFRELRRADAVFGRAEDGGYWLVGLRRRPKRVAPFENVRWSSPCALADTLRNLRAHRIAFAETLFDIDTEADYRRYLRGLQANRQFVWIWRKASVCQPVPDACVPIPYPERSY
jgi:glycosyltransferase A (GT-A) superfamily protein (DUF2064 family)